MAPTDLLSRLVGAEVGDPALEAEGSEERWASVETAAGALDRLARTVARRARQTREERWASVETAAGAANAEKARRLLAMRNAVRGSVLEGGEPDLDLLREIESSLANLRDVSEQRLRALSNGWTLKGWQRDAVRFAERAVAALLVELRASKLSSLTRESIGGATSARNRVAALLACIRLGEFYGMERGEVVAEFWRVLERPALIKEHTSKHTEGVHTQVLRRSFCEELRRTRGGCVTIARVFVKSVIRDAPSARTFARKKRAS